jgi:hypothetical protein
MDKPKAEVISYYGYDEVKDYISEKYNINKEIFEKFILNMNPSDNEMIFMHIGDYIAYKRYDSAELLEWFKFIEEEFGSFIVLLYEYVV